ncbi:MAG: DinB family protein [bacterium]|nr:DinB family protein [bacterium]
MDPYLNALLDRLGEADPIEVLNATPAHLLDLAERLSPDDWDAPLSPGGWSAAAIVAHLADVELAMGFRLRQAVAGQVAVQPFDQDAWARRYRRLDPAIALETLRATRAWNLALFATFGLDDWLTELDHPEVGPQSVDLVVRTLAGHDLRHLDRLASLLAR